MSATEWKPGDVAKVNGFIATRVVKGVIEFVRDENVRTARRLVVLDPESADDVQRLLGAFYSRPGEDVYPRSVSAMQAALRELANPTSPKPDEPTGLGAVAEDNEGCLWFRMAVENKTWPGEVWQEQYAEADRWSKWDDIDAVRVLSEGVTE